MEHFNFNLTAPRVGIDQEALYGFWERKDGSEGGGLWFEIDENQKLTLSDFDGATSLPIAIIESLLGLGIEVGEEFN